MAYERMLPKYTLCGIGAAVAVNGFKALDGSAGYLDIDGLARHYQIEAYLKRCVNHGAIPSRRWPLYGIEPAPLDPVGQGSLMDIEDTGLLVSIADFRAWIKQSGVQAPESWADAISDSIRWSDGPVEGTNVVTGEPKGGRPRMLPDNAQNEANEIALALYNLSGNMPTRKAVATKLAGNYGMAWSSVKDRFSVRKCHEYIEALKQ